MEELEELRKKASTLKKIRNIIATVIFATIIALWFLPFINLDFIYEISKYFFPETEEMFFIYRYSFGIIGMGVIILFYIEVRYGTIYKEYSTKYKQVIILEKAKEIFAEMNIENFEMDYQHGFPIDVIKESKMMCFGNRYESNDLYSGVYKDVGFNCSDILIQNITTDSDGGTDTTTYFKGQWYVLEFNKEFQGEFQVCEKTFKYSDLISIKDLEKVQVEDSEFNKIFNIYSNNAHSVFYVLTPHIIEAIKEINKSIEGELIFCFFNSKLHIGVSNDSDLFSPSVLKEINIEEEKSKIKKEVSPVIKLIDELRLDNKIFK